MASRTGNGRNSVSKTNLAARLLASIPANYVLSSLAAACIARLLAHGFSVPAAEASMAGTLLSFAIFATLALVAFGMQSIARVWLWMLASAAFMGALLWYSLLVGGRL